MDRLDSDPERPDVVASLTEEERALMDAYTVAEPCPQEGYPDAYWVVLRVGVQSFRLSTICDTKEEAEWTRAMLGKALARIVRLPGQRDQRGSQRVGR